MTGPASTPETESPGLTVRVESFVGPLDLLLHLCRTNEVDLANLPIRTITEQYLAYVEQMLAPTLNAGDILGLLGENGAGKTSLMNVLFGTYAPDGGMIEVEGKPVAED